MDNGRIIEQGTHEQLVAAGGYYATAFHNQYGEIPQEILNGRGRNKMARNRYDMDEILEDSF